MNDASIDGGTHLFVINDAKLYSIIGALYIFTVSSLTQTSPKN